MYYCDCKKANQVLDGKIKLDIHFLMYLVCECLYIVFNTEIMWYKVDGRQKRQPIPVAHPLENCSLLKCVSLVTEVCAFLYMCMHVCLLMNLFLSALLLHLSVHAPIYLKSCVSLVTCLQSQHHP